MNCPRSRGESLAAPGVRLSHQLLFSTEQKASSCPPTGTSAFPGGHSASSQVWELHKGGAWACFVGKGLTNQLTYPADWAEPAPCGCVSGCSEPPLASASPCSVPLPACEQRGAASDSRTGNCCTEQASTEPGPGAATCLCQGRSSQRQGKVLPKAGAGWEPAACCNSEMSLRKGGQQQEQPVGSSSWFLPMEPLFPDSRQTLTKLEIYFISLYLLPMKHCK